MGVARYIFNLVVDLFNKGEIYPDWMLIKTEIINSLPDWAKDVPYQIKSIAIKEACIAIQNAQTKTRNTHKPHKVGFRSRRKRRDSIYIPKSAVKGQKVYPRKLGTLETFREQIPETLGDCHFIYDHGYYFLIVLIKREDKPPENQRGEIVSLDPGVRTFQTFFSFDLIGKFGSKNFTRIYRLCYELDQIISKMSKAKCKVNRRLRKAADRIRFKIRNLVDEIHHKIANWLCRNYVKIVIPPFPTSKMVTKLRSKTSRAMLTWSHFRFQQFLKFKATEFHSAVIPTNEAYTSKTCTSCGKIYEIGSKEIFDCPSCKMVLDRDVNGARNIMLRALVDAPCAE